MWIPVKSFIRFVFNAHGEIGEFPFDENSLAFMARFITSRLYARVTIVIPDGFISLRFTCHGRKTRLLNVLLVFRCGGIGLSKPAVRLEIQA